MGQGAQASISRTLVLRIAIFLAIKSQRHQVAKLEAATGLAQCDGAKNRVSPPSGEPRQRIQHILPSEPPSAQPLNPQGFS